MLCLRENWIIDERLAHSMTDLLPFTIFAACPGPSTTAAIALGRQRAFFAFTVFRSRAVRARCIVEG
jgi:hypothetical protein